MSEPRGRLVRSGSRGFTQERLVSVRFIRVRVGSLGRTRGGRIHLSSRGFARAHLEKRRVHSGCRGFIPPRIAVVEIILVRVGSLGRAFVSSGFSRDHSVATRGRPVHSCSRGFTGSVLAVVGIIRVRVGSLVRT